MERPLGGLMPIREWPAGSGGGEWVQGPGTVGLREGPLASENVKERVSRVSGLSPRAAMPRETLRL